MSTLVMWTTEYTTSHLREKFWPAFRFGSRMYLERSFMQLEMRA